MIAVMLAVAVVFAPAAWLSPVLRSASKGSASFDAAWGTIWSGSAMIKVQRSSKEVFILPEPIAWTFDVPALLSGALSLNLSSASFDHKTISVQIQQPWRKNALLTVGAGQFALPVGALASLGAPFNTLRLTGDAAVRWGAISQPIDSSTLNAPLTLTLQGMRSAITPNIALGDYAVQIQPTGNQAQGSRSAIQLATTSPTAALQLSGSGYWSQNTAPQFELHAKPANTNDAAKLGALLNFLGRRQGDEWVLRLQ